MAEKETIVEVLKADVVESVSLFFAPVTAVVREFNRAVEGSLKVDASRELPKGTNDAQGKKPAD